MKNDHAILQAADAGYRGQPVAAMFSSPLWLGHMAGLALSEHGSAAPVRACSSRGYSVRVQDAAGDELIVKFLGDSLDRTEISSAKANQ